MKVLMDKTGSIKILKGHTKCKGKRKIKVKKKIMRSDNFKPQTID